MSSGYAVTWTSIARSDLTEIFEYLAIENTHKALQVLGKIEEQIKQLNTYPESGRVIPELGKHSITKYRELIINPWRVFYKIEKADVYILAVVDGRRNIEDILLKRQLR